MKRFNPILTLTMALLSLHTFALPAGSSPASDSRTAAAQQEERTTGSFKGVAAGGSLHVKVTLGNKESVRLEGDADAIADLVTEVKDGILTIRPSTKKWNDWSRKHSNARVTAYVSAKTLTSLTMSGSGSMEVQQTINTSELVTTVSGSGSIKATANLNSLVGVISGSGSLSMNGKADESNLTLSGSGNFSGKGFSVNDLSAQISGSASVYINAEKNINAVISGSGNISYTGNAQVKKTVIGSGSVRKI
jgi:hypothetical protein